MPEQLPEMIDPLRLVQKRAELRGVIPIARMPRVRDAVAATEGEVEIQLHFRQEGSVAAVEGRVAAELGLQCQCCLDRLAWKVDSQVSLGVVTSLEQANFLPEPYEPLLIGDSPWIRLLDIVEDEVLLALPIIPQHPYCGRHARASVEVSAGNNPFGILAALKKI